MVTGLRKQFGDIFSYLNTIQERDRQTERYEETEKTAFTHSVTR